MRALVLYLIVLIFLSDGFSLLRAEDYAIRLTSPSKVGLKYQLRSKCSDFRLNSLYSDGALLKQETETNLWDLDSTLEVISVNAQGKPTEVRVLIKGFQSQDKQQTNVLLVAGTEVKMTVNQNQVESQTNGVALSAKLNGMLISLLEAKSTSEPVDDQIWGTSERKKLGDTWRPDLDLVGKYLQQETYKIDPKTVQAQMKLAGLVPANGLKCLHITGKIYAPDVGVKLSRGMVVRNATLEFELTGLFPISSGSGCLQNSERTAFNMTAIGQTQDGHTIQLKAQAERKLERSYTY